MPERVRRLDEDGLIWGVHACMAVLSNPERRSGIRLYLTESRLQALDEALWHREGVRVETFSPQDLTRRLPSGAVHQGIALRAPPPEEAGIETLAESQGVIIVLDQVTDPQNIGAIFRSAAAFGAAGIILQDRHCPPLQGALAKAAAGALEQVPVARVVNLSRALETLGRQGWVSLGLAGGVDESLKDAAISIRAGGNADHIVVVMGSEGDGLRRLVAEHCDRLCRIPMPGGFESLNVSHAVSIVLYELCGRSEG